MPLGDLARRIAAGHGLQARVGSALRAVRIPHPAQTEESDLNLLTRLARDRDAVAKQSGDYLLLVPRGEVASATGKPMPAVDVRPEDTTRWRVTLADRAAYASAEARWHDPAGGRSEPRQPRRGGRGGAAAGRIPSRRGRLLDVPEGGPQAGSRRLLNGCRGDGEGGLKGH